VDCGDSIGAQEGLASWQITIGALEPVDPQPASFLLEREAHACLHGASMAGSSRSQLWHGRGLGGLLRCSGREERVAGFAAKYSVVSRPRRQAEQQRLQVVVSGATTKRIAEPQREDAPSCWSTPSAHAAVDGVGIEGLGNALDAAIHQLRLQSSRHSTLVSSQVVVSAGVPAGAGGRTSRPCPAGGSSHRNDGSRGFRNSMCWMRNGHFSHTEPNARKPR
jgi:hypothetical protein